MITTDNFILEDLTYIPMGAVNPMFSRPYLINATLPAIETISERLHDTKSGKVTANILGDVTGNIIQTSAVGIDTPINSDWVGTRRFIFLLKVKSFDVIGAELNSYIQGYTEYDGISNTGNIDGNLVHYINNVIETNSMTIQTPLGVIRKEKLYKIYNIFGSRDNNDYYSQRPNDVFENIQMLNMANIMPTNNLNVYNTNNFINPFNNNIVTSNIDNNITSEYLSKILNIGLLDNKEKDIFSGSIGGDMYSSENSFAHEPSANDNRFIKYLSYMAGFKTVREKFTFSQLLNIDNTIFSRFKLINLNKDYVNPVMMSTPEVGDYWHGRDPVTVKAYSLIESSVALATRYGFNKIYFTASNMSNPTGMAEIFITNFNSFINLEEHDFNFLLELFKTKFINEIFLSESNSGVIPMHVEGYIDLLGTSKICLTYAGYPTNWYTIPTTANSLYSPVITVDKQALDMTSFNVGQVIDAISSNNATNRQYF